MTSGPVPLRKALAAAILTIALFAAVVVQVTVVNRLPLPGAGAPDLVLLLVTAIAVVVPPATAAVTGFAGGLALDLAPPAAHYAGEYALVFCLAAYGAAVAYRAIGNMTGERDPVTAFTVLVIAAVAGEAGKAALGLLLSDPDVTPAAVSRVLPGAILYDLLAAPLAFWLVARITRAAAVGRAAAREFGREPGLASVFRQASAGAPNLRLAGTGMGFTSPPPARGVPRLRLAGTGMGFKHQPVAGRVPKLRLSGTGSGSISRTGAAFTGRSQLRLAAGQRRKLNFAGDLPVHAGARSARTPGKNWLRATGSPALAVTAKHPARGPGRGWLGQAGDGGPGAAWRTPERPSRLASVRIGRRAGDVINGRAAAWHTPRFAGGRRGAHPRRFASGTLGAAHKGGVPAPVPRTSAEALAARSAPSGLSALAGAGTPLAGRAPQAGWLSSSRRAPTAAVSRTPRSGWLGSSRTRSRTVIGSGVRGRPPVIGGSPGMRRGTFRRRRGTTGSSWSTASPSGAWLRRSRYPWRGRGRRLLRLVGVAK